MNKNKELLLLSETFYVFEMVIEKTNFQFLNPENKRYSDEARVDRPSVIAYNFAVTYLACVRHLQSYDG